MAETWSRRLAERAEARRAEGLWRARPTVGPEDGRLDFAGNDYLGLARDPRLAEAQAEGARRFGAGGRASHLVCGHQEIHEALERRLAALTGHLGERLSAHGMGELMPADHAAHMCTLRPPAERLDAVAAAVADAGIAFSLRGGGLRIAPHLNVDRAQLDRLVEVLRAAL